MKMTMMALSAFLVCAPAVAQFDPVHPGGSTIRVVDGDTVKVGETTYRLVGYNTPEVYAITHPCPAEVIAGKLASGRLAQLATNLRVEPVPCWDGRAKDRYGRTCARATYQGQDVADIMVNEGLAERLTTDRPQALKDWCKRPG